MRLVLYLKAYSDDDNNKQSNVAVIVLTHGHVAKGIADVANKLLDVNVAHGIEMDLNEKPEEALLRTIELVKAVDEGKGCLILIDMGSLVTFGEIITKRTGIPTRTIGRVDTIMALEAIRRSIIPDTTLDDVAEAIDNSKPFVGYIEDIKDKHKFPKVIVTICITGEGTAIKIKKYIEDKIHGISDQFKIIPIGVFNDNQIDKQIINIQEKNKIAAFVGTIDPKADNIPFISVEEVMDGGGLVRLKEILGMDLKTKSPISKIITEDLIFANINVKNKSDVIDLMVRKLENEGYVHGDFMLSVYKRESISTTWIKGNLAIPHGSTKYVTKPAIAIATLSKPIYWEGDFKTDLVFLIAFKEDSKDYMYNLYKVLKNENVMNALRTAKNPVEIKDIILEKRL
jgi:transcriptional regulatory protein LevR